MMKKVVALFGKTASGKTTCCRYVKNAYGFKILEIGNYARNMYKEESNFNGTLMDYANLHFDQGTITSFVSSAIARSKQFHGNVLFSGVRIIDELVCLKKEYPDIILIRIDCSIDNRSRRYYKETSDKVSFLIRDEVEDRWIGREWDSLHFDYIIVNDDDLAEFYKRIDSVFSKITGRSSA